MKILLTLAVAAMLTCASEGQATSEHSSASVVSDNTPNNGIEPVRPANSDEDENVNIVADPASLLPDPPPVPRANATLVGGTIERLDRLRDRITVGLFGGGRMTVLFDPRSRIYRDQAQGTSADLREGQRIYLDTILDGKTVFARSIRIRTTAAIGESQGVVLNYRTDRGELTVRDGISPSAIHLRITSSTRVVQGDRAVPVSMLVPGSLVGIQFDSQSGRGLAKQISILAMPGTGYTFAGKISHLNLSTGLLVLNSSVDHKAYEIYLPPSASQDENLLTGATVTIVARFQDSRYEADKITIDSSAQ